MFLLSNISPSGFSPFRLPPSNEIWGNDFYLIMLYLQASACRGRLSCKCAFLQIISVGFITRSLLGGLERSLLKQQAVHNIPTRTLVTRCKTDPSFWHLLMIILAPQEESCQAKCQLCVDSYSKVSKSKLSSNCLWVALGNAVTSIQAWNSTIYS